MSRFVACDAPDCDASRAVEAEDGCEVDPPLGWVAIGVRRPEHLRPYRTLHACSPVHAVRALGALLGVHVA